MTKDNNISRLTHWQKMNSLKLRKETHAFFSSHALHWLIFSVWRIKLKCSSCNLWRYFTSLCLWTFADLRYKNVRFALIWPHLFVHQNNNICRKRQKQYPAFNSISDYQRIFLVTTIGLKEFILKQILHKKERAWTEQRPTSSPTDFLVILL